MSEVKKDPNFEKCDPHTCCDICTRFCVAALAVLADLLVWFPMAVGKSQLFALLVVVP